MLHTIFNPCKHIASCCFVRFRSLSTTNIHNNFEKKIRERRAREDRKAKSKTNRIRAAV